MDKEKERLRAAFILEEFDGELEREVKERIKKIFKNEDDYLFIFFNSRQKNCSLQNLLNLLWKSFLRTGPSYDGLMFVAEYIPSLSERAIEILFKKQSDSEKKKTIRYLREYGRAPELENTFAKLAVRNTLFFEVRNAYKENKQPNRKEKWQDRDGIRQLVIKQLTEEGGVCAR